MSRDHIHARKNVAHLIRDLKESFGKLERYARTGQLGEADKVLCDMMYAFGLLRRRLHNPDEGVLELVSNKSGLGAGKED